MLYHPSRGDAATLEREAAAQGFGPWKNKQGATIGYRAPAAMDDPRPPLDIVIFHGNAGYALHRAAFCVTNIRPRTGSKISTAPRR